NKIKSEMQKTNDELKAKMIEVIESEIEVEKKIGALLNPMRPYFVKAAEVSKKEKELQDELLEFNTFKTENFKLLGSSKYNEYGIKVKSIENNFAELQKSKLKLE